MDGQLSPTANSEAAAAPRSSGSHPEVPVTAAAPATAPVDFVTPLSLKIPRIKTAHDASAGEFHASWEVLPRQWELSDFQPIEKLYRGYASKVYLAKDNGKIRKQGPNGEQISLPGDGRLVVLKVYDLLRLSPLTKYQLDREVRLHSSLQHENIVDLIATFTQADFRILVQSYAEGGDLYNHLRKQRVRMGEKKLVQMVLKPCLSALMYLHSKNIVHRDIKPENLLLDKGVIKLADFGLSINLSEENAVTRAGTLDYMAPEVLVCPLKRLPTDYKDMPNLAYSAKVDSWSMGVLAYELMTGHSPYQQRDETALLFAINNQPIRFSSGMTAMARDWLLRAFDKNAGTRASIGELLNHPWIAAHGRRSSVVLTQSPPLTDLAQEGSATPDAYGHGRVALDHKTIAHVRGEEAKLRPSGSLSPAVMGIRLQDDTPSGCRSPAALQMGTGGNTPTALARPHPTSQTLSRNSASSQSPRSSSPLAPFRSARDETPVVQLSGLHPARSTDLNASK